MKITAELSLSIGFSGAEHRETIEIDDAPDGLDEEDLTEWVRENHWEEWASGHIEGDIEILARDTDGVEP